MPDSLNIKTVAVVIFVLSTPNEDSQFYRRGFSCNHLSGKVGDTQRHPGPIILHGRHDCHSHQCDIVMVASPWDNPWLLTYPHDGHYCTYVLCKMPFAWLGQDGRALTLVTWQLGWRNIFLDFPRLTRQTKPRDISSVHMETIII